MCLLLTSAELHFICFNVANIYERSVLIKKLSLHFVNSRPIKTSLSTSIQQFNF